MDTADRPEILTYRAYRVLGTTDEVTTCEACGRPELKGTVVLQPLDADGNDDGEPCYYGSSCGAKLAKSTTREINAQARKADREAAAAAKAAEEEARRREWEAGRPARIEAHLHYLRWIADTYGARTEADAYEKRLDAGERTSICRIRAAYSDAFGSWPVYGDPRVMHSA
jgi:hypothetical protein